MAHTAQQYVGSYRLLNLLRVGKTCQVWEAINDARGARYAIKLLLTEFHSNREEVGYLKHEFEVARRLEHPNVIRLYEFGKDREDIYLAMELFAVPNLKQLIQQGAERLAPLIPDFIEGAGQGLSYFHSQGWIHRDIKPDNFLMNDQGDVKLIDFALAQRKRRGLARLLNNKKAKIQGTRSYISPEQIRNQVLDERADLYSFGCLLFELASGKVPFTGSSTNELLTKHLKSPVPALSHANREVTPEFSQLVRGLMAKSPDERPASMADFVRDAQAVKIFKNMPARPQSKDV